MRDCECRIGVRHKLSHEILHLYFDASHLSLSMLHSLPRLRSYNFAYRTANCQHIRNDASDLINIFKYRKYSYKYLLDFRVFRLTTQSTNSKVSRRAIFNFKSLVVWVRYLFSLSLSLAPAFRPHYDYYYDIAAAAAATHFCWFCSFDLVQLGVHCSPFRFTTHWVPAYWRSRNANIFIGFYF